MKHICKTVTALCLALMLLTGTALADWVCSGCGNTASGNFCSNCGQAKGGELPIFSEYENSTKNMLRATINGERIAFYLREAEHDDWLGKSYTVAAATYVAYYPDGSARCEIIIQLPEDISGGKTVTSSSKDVYKFTYYNKLNDDNKWASPTYRLWRGKMYNDENHVDYGKFRLVTDICNGSHYSGTLDCTLTASNYKSGGYHYDASDTVTIEDIEFDYLIGASHPVYEELGISKVGKLSGGSSTSGSKQSDSQYCSYCYGLGQRECGVCQTFGQCMACSGFGHSTRITMNGMEYVVCGLCGGTGACSSCGYSGFVFCTFCGGTGRVN